LTRVNCNTEYRYREKGIKKQVRTDKGHAGKKTRIILGIMGWKTQKLAEKLVVRKKR